MLFNVKGYDIKIKNGFLLLFFLTNLAIADPVYNYLCGNDEGGCQPGRPDTCVCVAQPTTNAKCLDKATLQCVAPSKNNQCTAGQTDEINTATCLAKVWQSSTSMPCQTLYKAPTAKQCSSECTGLENCHKTPTTE